MIARVRKIAGTLRQLSLLLTLIAVSNGDIAVAELKPAELYKRVLPSVITLQITREDGQEVVGSAFLAIKDGVAVTAWHVVKDAKTVMAKFSDSETFEVSGLIDKDEARDLALIKVKAATRPLLKLSSTSPEVGVKAYVVGAPKGFEFSISDGLISQIQTMAGHKEYQFSCPSSPGNSGGPLLNEAAEVIGVVSWQHRDGQNLNFAVPSIYALGLDATLPTSPWTAITSTPPPAKPAAQKVVRYNAQPGSRVQVCSPADKPSLAMVSSIVGGFVEADAGFPESAVKPSSDTPNPKVEAAVTVRTLKSGSEKLDAIVYELLDHSNHPKLEFRLLALKFKSPVGRAGYQFDATGTLTVGGVTITNTIPVTVERINGEKLRVSSVASMKMTDFGIKPPSKLPTVRGNVEDKMAILIDWFLVRHEGTTR